MKPPFSSLLRHGLAALIVSSFALATGVAQEKPALRAGAAAVDVTPKEFPLNMPGGFEANGAQGAHDPLHSRALVLDDGKSTVALVVVDNLGLAREVVDEAKALASQRCGIPADKILVSATHTHSGPPSNSTTGPAQAVAYRKILLEGIAESIVKAHGALRPATLGSGADQLPEEVFNRRWYLKDGQMKPNPFGKMDQVRTNPGTSPTVLDRPAGPTDPDISILSVMDAKSRKPIALYANYALHYVGGIPAGQMSADYFGEFARLMTSRVRGDADFVAMMSNGASGNINNIPFLVNRPPREPFEQVRIVATKAADTAWRAKNAIAEHRADVLLGMRQREVTLRNRRPNPEQIADAQAILAIKDDTAKASLPRLAENYARRTMGLADAAETLSAPIQAIRIGDTAICAIPFEVFVEIGLELKKRSPFPRTIVVGLANASHGYLPTPEHHKLGGYETWLGTNRVQEDASTILTEQLLEMLKELRGES